MMSFTVCTAHQILSGWLIQWRWDGRACRTNRRDEECIGFLGQTLSKDIIWRPPPVDKKIILKWMLNMMRGRKLESSDFRSGQVAGSWEKGNAPSGSIQQWELLDRTRNRQVIDKGPAACSELESQKATKQCMCTTHMQLVGVTEGK